MKKSVIIILTGAMLFALTACGSSMESDAKKVAKRAIEIEQVYKSLDDRSNLSGSRESKEQKFREYTEFANKMLEKYGQDRETREKFNELVEKEIKNLKGK